MSELTGTPTSSGTFNPVITVIDAAGLTATVTLPLTVAAAPAGPPLLAGNLLTLAEQSFETAVTTWVRDVNVQPEDPRRNSERAYDGTFSLYWMAADPGRTAVFNATYIPVLPGRRVRVSARVLQWGTIPGHLEVHWYNGTTWISQSNTPAVTLQSSTFTEVQGVVTAPSGINAMRLQFAATTVSTWQQFWLDAAFIGYEADAPLANTTGTLPPGQATIPYSAALSAEGGTPPYTFTATGLPAGLSVSGSQITGTPATAGTSSNVVITARDSATPQATAAVTRGITVSAAPSTTEPLAVANTSLPGAVQGQAWAWQLDATGGTQPYTWTHSGLPPGITRSGSRLSGTPTSTGTWNVTLNVSGGGTASRTLALTVAAPHSQQTHTTQTGTSWTAPADCPPTISVECWGGGGGGGSAITANNNRAGSGGAGGNYSAEPSLAVTPGRAYTYAIGAGGRRGDSSAPSAGGGQTRFAGDTVTVAANGGGRGVQAGPAQTGGSDPGQPGNPSQNTIRFLGGWGRPASDGSRTGGAGGGSAGPGGNGHPEMRIAWGWQPMTQVPSGGAIGGAGGVNGGWGDAGGQPGAGAGGGGASATSGAFGGTGRPGQLRIRWTPTLPRVTSTSLAQAQAGQSVTRSLTATAGRPPYTWAASGLPPGTSITGSQITGTPTAGGTFSTVLAVTDANSRTATQAVTWTVLAPPPVISVLLPSGTVGQSYSATLSATGGTTPYTWQVTGLPPGLTRSGAAISGTPTAGGNFNITITVTDAVGGTATVTTGIWIEFAQLTLDVQLPDGTAGQTWAGVASAQGGAQPYTYTATGLPPGISISPNGILTGVPTEPGDFEVTVTARSAPLYSVDFEDGTAGGWEPWYNAGSGTLVNDPYQANSGYWSFRWTSTETAPGDSAVRSPEITVTPSAVYEASMALFGGPGQRIQLGVRFYATPGGAETDAAWSGPVYAPAGGGGWVPLRFQFTVPAGITRMRLTPFAPVTGAGIRLGVDDITVTAGPPVGQATVTVPVRIDEPLPMQILTELPGAEVPGWEAGQPWEAADLVVFGGIPPHAWAVTGLPPGLTQEGSRITGRPDVPGQFHVTITVTDLAGSSVSVTQAIYVFGAPVRVWWAGLECSPGHVDEWFTAVVEDVDGWFSTMVPDGNDQELILADGSAWGPKVLRARQITITGAAAGPRRDLMLFRDQLAARVAAREPTELRITDWSLGPRTALVRAGTDAMRHSFIGGHQAFRYEITVTAADPRLYGPWQEALLSNVPGEDTGRGPYGELGTRPTTNGTTIGQTTSTGGRQFTWNGSAWVQVTPFAAPTRADPRRYPDWRYASAQIPNMAYVANTGNVESPVMALYTGPLSETRLTDGSPYGIIVAPLAAGETILVNTETLVAVAPGGATRAAQIRPGSRPVTARPGDTPSAFYMFGTGAGTIHLAWRSAWA